MFLSRVLMSDEENMDPADYEMVGVLGESPARSARAEREKSFTRRWEHAACAARAAMMAAPSRRERSCGHALRKGNCLRALVERNVGRRMSLSDLDFGAVAH